MAERTPAEIAASLRYSRLIVDHDLAAYLVGGEIALDARHRERGLWGRTSTRAVGKVVRRMEHWGISGGHDSMVDLRRAVAAELIRLGAPVSTPTEKDRARARVLRRGPRHTPGEPEDGWIARVEEFGAQCMAAERARIVEALRAKAAACEAEASDADLYGDEIDALFSEASRYSATADKVEDGTL